MNRQPAETVNLSAEKTCANGVRFSRLVLVRRTLSIHEYTDDEIDACWYGETERLQIKQELRDTLCLLTKQDFDPIYDIGMICERGLEHYSKQGMKLRRLRRKAAYDAVFDEQERQFLANEWDDKRLAVTYAELTAKSKLKAYVVGVEDQKQCEKLYEVKAVKKASSDPCLLRTSSPRSQRPGCHHRFITNNVRPWMTQ